MGDSTTNFFLLFTRSAEAALALRQRLNETVEELDDIRRKHTELEVKYETLSAELTIAKSDLNLVNKDQLDILHTLRESVNEDKAELEAENARIKDQVQELQDKAKMQLEQINSLLMEKVNLQSEGIGQRERMLERERDYSDLRAQIAGKDLPEETKSRVLALHEENVQLKEANRTQKQKLLEAKQHKLFEAESQKKGSPGTFDEAEESFRSQIKILQEEVARQKQIYQEAVLRYSREQELILGAIHAQGMRRGREHLAGKKARDEPKNAWLSQQRYQSASLRR
ncbi:hypothetical protein BOTBODRAFT_395757 [Botryobasidium botryosum FD-172 SS1]|uniref:Hook C-terminal domain-containing protein n=1 Tax=Botryobasidium botryosum (strain FD-172 SS1) TaxID=930990 RepID=A0A067MBI4_BOTB1|nr:hypothetical protein BOTBODRAFT_395757 [Botryobasidium botryosum FD-172 SS1]